MVISGKYKNNYDTATNTAHNSMGVDTKATQSSIEITVADKKTLLLIFNFLGLKSLV